MENTHIALKIVIIMFMDMPTVLHKNILKFVQIILEKYWAFFLPHHRFLLPQLNLKETSVFFYPQEGQICGVKKRHCFITKNTHTVLNI